MSFEFFANETAYAHKADLSDEALNRIRGRKIGKAMLFAVK